MTMSYSLTNNAGGKFKLVGSAIKTAAVLASGVSTITLLALSSDGWSKSFDIPITITQGVDTPMHGDVYVDFANKPDGAPSITDTGQPIIWDTSASANTIVNPTVAGGALIASGASSNGSVTATYPGIRCKEEVRGYHAGISFGDADDAAALIAASDSTLLAIKYSSIHPVFYYDHMVLGYWSNNVLTAPQTIYYSPVAFNTEVKVGWRLNGNDVYVLLPDGTEAGPHTLPEVATRSNHCAIFEHFCNVAGAPTTKIFWVSVSLFADPIEAGRTNLLSQRNNVNNAVWAKTSIGTVTAAQTDADGGALADRVLEQAATSSHNIAQTLTKTGATKLYTMRAKVKGVSRGWAALYAGNNAFNDTVKAFFNIGSAAVGTLANGTTTFKLYGWMAYDLGNGWVQIEIEFITDSDTTLKPLFLIASGDNTASFLGDMAKGMLVYDEWVFERPI